MIEHKPAPQGQVQYRAPKSKDPTESEDWYRFSKDIPGLSEYTFREAEKLRKKGGAGNRRKALNLVVKDLVSYGAIDENLLKGKRMYYNAGLGAGVYGVATPRGYRKDPSTKKKVAKPTRVEIGPSAFRNLPLLYSTIMHEYQHVLQFQKPGAKGTSGQVAIQWLIDRQEVEAYSWEILNSKTTGLFNKRRLMREKWQQVKHFWNKLGPKGRKLLKPLYEKARTFMKEAREAWKSKAAK